MTNGHQRIFARSSTVNVLQGPKYTLMVIASTENGSLFANTADMLT